MHPDDPSRTPHQSKENRVFNKTKRIATLAAAAFAVFGLTACDPSQIEGKPTPTTERLVDAGIGEWVAPTSTIEIPAPVDPLSTNGTWLVPSEIGYGTYKVTPTSDFLANWTLCGNLSCSDIIQIEIVDGPGYIEIGPDAVAVELDDVVLTPMEG